MGWADCNEKKEPVPSRLAHRYRPLCRRVVRCPLGKHRPTGSWKPTSPTGSWKPASPSCCVLLRPNMLGPPYQEPRETHSELGRGLLQQQDPVLRPEISQTRSQVQARRFVNAAGWGYGARPKRSSMRLVALTEQGHKWGMGAEPPTDVSISHRSSNGLVWPAELDGGGWRRRLDGTGRSSQGVRNTVVIRLYLRNRFVIYPEPTHRTLSLSAIIRRNRGGEMPADVGSTQSVPGNYPNDPSPDCRSCRVHRDVSHRPGRQGACIDSPSTLIWSGVGTISTWLQPVRSRLPVGNNLPANPQAGWDYGQRPRHQVVVRGTIFVTGFREDMIVKDHSGVARNAEVNFLICIANRAAVTRSPAEAPQM